MSMAPLLAYYGDDLTGSTDVMEALELRGVPAVLFTGIPSPGLAARFQDRKAIGIAGTSRSETPEWMDRNLPIVFRWLKELRPALCHYKVCSTFDSSPAIGSIGRAIDIGAAVFGQASTPLVVGAPELKRYTAFGNLFAVFRGEIHRIDRHPVMRQHPVTPMDEADLRRHLARQTEKPVGLIDLVSLKHAIPDAEVDTVFRAFPVVLLDVIDEETQAAVGRHLWRRRDASPFVVGSSGVEYALAADGAETPLSGRRRDFDAPGGRRPVAVVSGSCSPTTERQIRYAVEHGFAGIPLDAAALAGDGAGAQIARAVADASGIIARGASPLLYTALGAETEQGRLPEGGGQRIGRALGRILAELIRHHRLARAIVAGGDTSSHAIAELGIEALECRMPLPDAPGSPLCMAHRAKGEEAAFEIAFKGGQVGGDDYFVLVRDI
jgi:3-oxoisoapionate kinase